ncbi:MAG: FAD-dependent oxidoreductase [Ferrimicrobium sp.]
MAISQMTKADLDARVSVTVFADRCAGCQECVIRCPVEALSMDPERWIAVADSSACVGCRQCVRSCPFSAIVVEGPMLVAPRSTLSDHHASAIEGDIAEVRGGFADLAQAQLEAQRCLECPDPTCVRGCPAHNDIPGFIGAVAKGDLVRAREILSLTSCLSGACSRVCDWGSQCEGSCTWSLAGGQGVAVGKIERFISDNTDFPNVLTKAPANSRRVAVVGAGPAGIGAAYELTKQGASVEVFEQDEHSGGVMRWGIPSYVLPGDAWHPTLDALGAAGVQFHNGASITPEMVTDLSGTFDAVILSAGAMAGIQPRANGLDLDGVVDATTFLDRAKSTLEGQDGAHFDLEGKRIIVLGAGNTAMDVARSALRLGASATAVDWMDERFSRARKDEIIEAREEGVEVLFLRTVLGIDPNETGGVGGVVVAKTEQSGPLATPKVLEGSSHQIQADMVVLAMGYRVEEAWKALPSSVALGVMPTLSGMADRAWIASGYFFGSTSLANLALGRERSREVSAFPVSRHVWAVGDLKVGPSTVVTAMAQGMSAARGVMGGLHNVDPIEGDDPTSEVLVVFDGADSSPRDFTGALKTALNSQGLGVASVKTTLMTLNQLVEPQVVILCFDDSHLPLMKSPSALRMERFALELPPLHGKTVVPICIHTHSTSEALKRISAILEAKGAKVEPVNPVSPKRLDTEASSLADRLSKSLSVSS